MCSQKSRLGQGSQDEPWMRQCLKWKWLWTVWYNQARGHTVTLCKAKINVVLYLQIDRTHTHASFSAAAQIFNVLMKHDDITKTVQSIWPISPYNTIPTGGAAVPVWDQKTWRHRTVPRPSPPPAPEPFCFLCGNAQEETPWLARMTANLKNIKTQQCNTTNSQRLTSFTTANANNENIFWILLSVLEYYL